MAAFQGFNPYGGYGVPAQMPQPMYPQAPQQAYMAQQMAQNQQMPQQPNVTVRLVTSRDEATTAQIPFDSTINVFVNPSAGEVYIKRFNPNTGGAVFGTYIDAERARQEAESAAKPQQEYATVDMLAGLESRISELEGTMSSRRATRSAKNDE
ncbi:MAG: hypothetical protein IJ418_09165 [Clostridia bacterium]|nr:hypothetical protein [Clostridia bacterium]